MHWKVSGLFLVFHHRLYVQNIPFLEKNAPILELLGNTVQIYYNFTTRSAVLALLFYFNDKKAISGGFFEQ